MVQLDCRNRIVPPRSRAVIQHCDLLESAYQLSEPTELDSALPGHPQRRDLLGQFCFYLHFAVMIYIVAGWLIPWRAMLAFYMLFIPAIYLQWQFNQDSCVLNNLESWLRTGKWRNREANPEEGAWLLTLVTDVTGLRFTASQINILTNCALILLWVLALAHFSRHP